jgi:hypothetical protein
MIKLKSFLNYAFFSFLKLLILGISLIIVFGFIGAGITAIYLNWFLR